MGKMSLYILAVAVARTFMIGVSSAAQAGGEKDDSSVWALANILHGLANALNGPGQRGDAAAVQTSEVSAEHGVARGEEAPGRTGPRRGLVVQRVAGTSAEGTSF